MVSIAVTVCDHVAELELEYLLMHLLGMEFLRLLWR